MTTIEIKSGNNTGNGTYKQLDYLASLCGESSFGFSHKKWCKFFDKKELSNAIEAKNANSSTDIIITL